MLGFALSGCAEKAVTQPNQTAAGGWLQTAGPARGTVAAVLVTATGMFAGTWGGGIFRSTDDGASWRDVNAGLGSWDVRALAISGPALLAGTAGGVYGSLDSGESWTVANGGLTQPDVRALAVIGSDTFAGTYGGGVFRSPDQGATWVQSGLVIESIQALVASGSTLLAGTSADGVFRSSDDGGGGSRPTPASRSATSALLLPAPRACSLARAGAACAGPTTAA